jgi:hypothetical protein
VVKSSFSRRLERPVSLIIAAQNLRLSACFDTLLQMDEVGIILKKRDLQLGDLLLRQKAEVCGIEIMHSSPNGICREAHD